MRKLNREKQVFTNGTYTVLAERIKNDRCGNGRTQLDIMKDGEYLGTYNVQENFRYIENYIEDQVFTGKFLER